MLINVIELLKRLYFYVDSFCFMQSIDTLFLLKMILKGKLFSWLNWLDRTGRCFLISFIELKTFLLYFFLHGLKNKSLSLKMSTLANSFMVLYGLPLLSSILGLPKIRSSIYCSSSISMYSMLTLLLAFITSS